MNKYDICDFQFSCFHECYEGNWGKCSNCISRTKCKKGSRPVYPSEEGFYYSTGKIEISPKHVEDLDFYIHEFTEATIISFLRKLGPNWQSLVEFKKEGIKLTYIAHVISLYGEDNGRCIEPVTKSNRPEW